MASTALVLALFIVPVALIFIMRKGTLFGNGKPTIPAVRNTPNCDAASHWCTCPNGESWQMGEASTCEDCKNECYSRMGAVPTDYSSGIIDDYYGELGTPTNIGTNMVEGTIQFPLSEKIAIPIIGGKMDWDNRDYFDNFAHGACRCDDYECCYKAPYQSERGDIRTERSCESVYYGDKMQACDNAFLNWQDDMYDSGIDSNNFISHKINDKRFFYQLGYDERNGNAYRHRKNRHAYSGRRTPSEHAYMRSSATSHRPYNQRTAPANLDHNIRGQTKSALYKILREKSAAKRLKYTRLARKLL